jgi:hypothetical protein
LYCDAKAETANRLFKKCVSGHVDDTSAHDLSDDERRCAEEYVMLYAQFTKNEFQHYQQLYEAHQRDMYEKARMEAMQMQARSELGKGKKK